MLTPALLGLAVFFVYPLVANLYYSFTRFNLLSPPEWIGLRNYQYLFTKDPMVATAALNTLWLVLILVPVRIITALAIAGLLVRAKRASGFWRTVFYLPSLVPPVASVVAFVFMERHWNMVTRHLSAAVVGDIAALVEMVQVYPQENDYSRL